MDFKSFANIATPDTIAEMTVDGETYRIKIPYFAFSKGKMNVIILGEDPEIKIDISPDDGATFKVINLAPAAHYAMR